MAFPDIIGSVVARHLMGNISRVYVPELQVGLTPGKLVTFATTIERSTVL